MCWPLTEARGVYAGRACGGGHRHCTQDKWTIQCVKFSVAGAQGTHGGGRAERAATETGRKAECPSGSWGNSRVSCAYLFTFSSIISELKGFFACFKFQCFLLKLNRFHKKGAKRLWIALAQAFKSHPRGCLLSFLYHCLKNVP